MVQIINLTWLDFGHSTHYRDFKLATSAFVLYILDVDLYIHIPQALRFYHISSTFWFACCVAYGI